MTENPVVWFFRNGNLVLHLAGEDVATIPAKDLPYLMLDLCKSLKERLRDKP